MILGNNVNAATLCSLALHVLRAPGPHEDAEMAFANTAVYQLLSLRSASTALVPVLRVGIVARWLALAGVCVPPHSQPPFPDPKDWRRARREVEGQGVSWAEGRVKGNVRGNGAVGYLNVTCR